MKLSVDRQQRNYNFLELVKGYNSALSKDPIPLYINSVFDLNCNLIGMESADKIYDALTPSNKNIDNNKSSLDLFYESNGKYYFKGKQKILPVATKEEAATLYSMIKKGDFDLYLDDSEKNILFNNIDSYFNNINEKPLDLFSYIEEKGESHIADNLLEQKDKFKVLNDAVKFNLFANIKYKGEYIDVQPVKIEYSQFYKKLILNAFISDGTYKKYYFESINEAKLLKNPTFEAYKNFVPKINKLVFSFENNYNLPERVAARFSDYQKEIHYNKNTDSILYIVDYEDTPQEKENILSILCSLGKRISIQSEEKSIVKAEASKALAQYK